MLQKIISYCPCGSMQYMVAFVSCIVLASMVSHTLLLNTTWKCMVNSTALAIRYPTVSDLSVTTPGCTNPSNHTQYQMQLGELMWMDGTKLQLLGGFAGGYILAAFTGGFLSAKCGGRKVLAYHHFTMATSTACFPIAARHLNMYIVILIQVFVGIGAGATLPAVVTVWNHWFPPLRRATLTCLGFIGIPAGAILIYSQVELLCFYQVPLQWTLNFYIQGGFGVIAGLLWLGLIADAPSKDHSHISDREQHLLMLTLDLTEPAHLSQHSRIQWAMALISRPFWGLVVGHLTAGCALYSLLYTIPAFLLQVKGLDLLLVNHGCTWQLGCVFSAVVLLASGLLSDRLVTFGINMAALRAIFQTTGALLLAGLFVGITFTSCEKWQSLVAMVIFALGAHSVFYCGHMINHMDVAPRQSGILLGITVCCSVLLTSGSHVLLQLFMPQKTVWQWELMLYLSAGVLALGGLLYPLLVSGRVQPWVIIDPITRQDLIPMVTQREPSVPRAVDDSSGIRSSSSPLIPPKNRVQDPGDCTVPLPPSWQDLDLTHPKYQAARETPLYGRNPSPHGQLEYQTQPSPLATDYSASPTALPLQNVNGLSQGRMGIA